MPSSRPNLLILALLSLGLIALEITWTRIFSAEYFYTFAFLILSLAVLGLGLGGLALRLAPRLSGAKALPASLLATALLALAGPPAVLHLGLDFARLFTGPAMMGRLVLTLAFLGSAFFTGGLALTQIFRAHHDEMPRLYMADLLGAGLGVAGVVLAMNLAGTPRTAFLLVLPLAAAAFLAGGRIARTVAVLVAGAACALLPLAPRMIARPRKELAPVVYRHWDATSLIKVLQFEDELGINIDNAANTPLLKFDGDWEALRREPFYTLMDPKPLMDRTGGRCRFLAIGSGGGSDVLLALRNGAAEVHAVEVNPAINRMLLRGGRYAGYTGNLYQDPRVRVATEDARTYVRRFRGAFDLIYSRSSNSFAALMSGAFAMSENYVFTTEALADDLRALAPGGFLVMEHQFYIPRVVSEALDALRRCGVHDPERHIAVFEIPQGHYPRQVLLVGRDPLTPEDVQHAFSEQEAKDFNVIHRLYPDPEPGASLLTQRIVQEGWRRVAPQSPTDLSPVTDDRPFIAMQGQLRNVTLKGLRSPTTFEIKGFPVAKVTVLAVLATTLLLVLPLSLLPRLQHGPRLLAPGWLYFFAIGAAFMALEVVLIQKYTRFIGASSWTVAAILVALLAGSGLGSRFAPRFRDRTPFLAIVAWLVLDGVAFNPLTGALVGLSMPARAVAAMLLLAPLAFFMGMPFTKGTARVGDCIDWGFAVNGAASVLGSTGILLVSFQWGFPAALALGGALYLAAMALLERQRPWVRAA